MKIIFNEYSYDKHLQDYVGIPLVRSSVINLLLESAIERAITKRYHHAFEAAKFMNDYLRYEKIKQLMRWFEI